MLRPRMRGLGILVLALTAACAEPRVLAVAPAPAASYARAFPVVVDLEGRPLRVLDPLAIEDGRVVAPGPLSFELDLDAEALVLVAFDTAALAAEVPAYAVDRASELRVDLEAPPEAPEFSGFGPDEVRVSALPGAVDVLATDAGGTLTAWSADAAAVLRAEITARVPVDREYCRLDGAALTPFAAQAALLPSDEGGGLVRAVRRLDDDRVLALTRTRLLLFHRTDAPDAPTLDVDLTLGADVFPRAETWSVRAAGDDLVVLIAGDVKTCDGGDECDEGRVWRVAVRGDTLSTVETTTAAPGLSLAGVAVDGERSFVVGERGTVWVGDADGRGWAPTGVVPVDPLSGLPVDLDRVAVTGDATSPHVAVGTNLALFGDLEQAGLQTAELSLPTQQRLQFDDLAVVGDTVWAVTARDGVLVGPRGGPLAPWAVVSPPSYTACAQGPGGLPVEPGQLAVDGGDVWVAGECTALLLVRGDGCVTSLPIAGRAVAAEARVLDAVHVGARWVTAGGANGTIYEWARP